LSSLQNKPLINAAPGESRNFAAGMAAVLDMHTAQRVRKLWPAQIVAYNRTTNIATVQPMIMLIDTGDTARMRQQIASVPVLSLGGGGFHVSFPLKQGDFGWILAADRDISTFLENLTPAPPNTLRKHRFEDSWFIPDVYHKYTINGSDSNAMVIQSVDGTTRISIIEGQVNIFAPTSVTVTTPQATFTQNVAVQGNLAVTGNTTVNGGFNANGSSGATVALPANATIGGIVVATHGHDGVQTGSSRTGGGMVS
jgi:hypothetical protein